MKKKLSFISIESLILTLIIFFGFASAIAFAAPKSELIPRWQAHDARSQSTIDHSPLKSFLHKYREEGSDGVARLAYTRVSPTDHQSLKKYVERLQTTPVLSLNRNEQYAFWVNLYNAATVDLILDYQPETGIKEINISPGFFSVGPWGKKYLKVEGSEISLNTIEHNILRPIWKDPRTHYVLNCASIGCPDIPADPVQAQGLEQQLEEAARTYINHPRGVLIDQSGSVILSSIYDWFSEDFGDTESAILTHLRRYATEDLKIRLRGVTEIDGYRYDWSLNRSTKTQG
ncbi:MAG: DUF547 domain-containing protein [Sneathiella sp.]